MSAVYRSLLFIINQKSGPANDDYESLIHTQLAGKGTIQYHIHHPDWEQPVADIRSAITRYDTDTVIAIGGDGTVKLVAESVYGTSVQLGIIPGGSGNGMAKDLGIPDKFGQALQVILEGRSRKVSSVRVNGHFSIHLSDIGFNATVIKQFEHMGQRGLRGYIKAGLKVLRKFNSHRVFIKTPGGEYSFSSIMVVIANATMYGTGMLINPVGVMDDDVFEIVVLKRISVSELIKMAFNYWIPNTDKTEIIQAREALITTQTPVHFQVDGEYLGKTKRVEVVMNPEMINVLVP